MEHHFAAGVGRMRHPVWCASVREAGFAITSGACLTAGITEDAFIDFAAEPFGAAVVCNVRWLYVETFVLYGFI
jgi:hypothetical protein